MDDVEHDEERRALSSGMRFASGSFLVNGVITTASAIVTSRLYGVHVIGQFAVASTPYLVTAGLSSAQEQPAMVRRMSSLPRRSAEASGLFYTVFTFSAALTAIVGLAVLAVSAAALDGPVSQPEVVVPAALMLGAYVVFENTSWNWDSVFSCYHGAREMFVARATQVTSFLALAIAFRPFTASVWGLAAPTAISFVIAFGVRATMIRPFLVLTPRRAAMRAGLAEVRHLVRFSAALVPAAILATVTRQSVVWILSARSTIGAVGAYARSAQIAARVDEAGFRIVEMLYPQLNRYVDRDDHRSFAETLARTARLTAVALAFGCALGGGAAEGVMRVFGDGFTAGSGAFAFLLASQSLYVISQVLGAGLLALNRTGVISIVLTVRCLAGFALVVVAIEVAGITEVAAAWFAAFAVQVVALEWCLRRASGGHHRFLVMPEMSRIGIAFAASFAVARLGDQLVPWPFGTGLGMAAAAVVFAALVHVNGVIRPAERLSAADHLEARLPTAGRLLAPVLRAGIPDDREDHPDRRRVVLADHRWLGEGTEGSEPVTREIER